MTDFNYQLRMIEKTLGEAKDGKCSMTFDLLRTVATTQFICAVVPEYAWNPRAYTPAREVVLPEAAVRVLNGLVRDRIAARVSWALED